MPKSHLTNYEYLKKTVLALDDDLSRPWSDYPCLEWQLPSAAGYPSIYDSERKVKRKAHQISFWLVKGNAMSGHVVCHHCDNRKCYRPIHLFSGTHRENAVDKVEKGRCYMVNNTGERHGMSKLSDADVVEIRRLRSHGFSCAAIARFFEVRSSAISRIISGERRAVYDPLSKSEYKNKYEYLKATVLSLNDDHRIDWREYPCIEWVGAVYEGYGTLRVGGVNGRSGRAHREAYELVFGKLEDPGLMVCHKCDNRRCFRPIHLFSGSPKENVKDMMSKGRRFQYDASGERAGGSKLCEDDVRKIKILHLLGVTNGKISKMFDVHQPAISNILTGKRWRKITGTTV